MTKFAVVIPAYNRADTLPRALDSLIAQTHEDWSCLVVDDGSTDSTCEVAQGYACSDERVGWVRCEENAGEVISNWSGLDWTLENRAGFDAWTRLGSDDYFSPNKLEMDSTALETHRVCYGPAGVMDGRSGDQLQVINLPFPSSGIREQLIGGRFLCSWANIAVRVDVLREVRDRFGGWVGSGLRHMTDFHLNSRIARVADFAWRGLVDGVYTESTEGINMSSRAMQRQIEPDAYWVKSDAGLSAVDHEVRQEHALTVELIKADG